MTSVLHDMFKLLSPAKYRKVLVCNLARLLNFIPHICYLHFWKARPCSSLHLCSVTASLNPLHSAQSTVASFVVKSPGCPRMPGNLDSFLCFFFGFPPLTSLKFTHAMNDIIRHGKNWSVEEERVLLEGYRTYGPCWTTLASLLPERKGILSKCGS